MVKAETILLKDPFSRKTGRRMGAGLVEKLGMAPDACWLFCSPENGLESLAKGVYEAVGTRLLIGCTTAGEISTAGFTNGSAVLGGVASDQIGFEVVSVTDIGRDSEQAGRDLATAFSDSVRYVQLFSDGITGDGSAILRGMASAFGKNIPVGGGTSGDAGKFLKTWQFAGDRVLSDAAVAIGFTGDFKLGTGVRSGWSPIGLPKKVTRAVGNILYELNGESALNVYERFLGKHAEKLPAVGVEYPLGLIGQFEDLDGNGQLLMRATMSVDREERSIHFAGEIPEGTMVYLTCGDRTSLLDATETAVRSAIQDLGHTTRPSLVFFYSCMARRALLGLRTKEEVDRVRSQFSPEVPLLGFYTYGEYCRIKPGGPSLLHNETATLSVIGV
ncbi:FIST signal transduction protein [Desulfococcus sp.]|uniref:FIST signal transduction protein n=1 Tax=Desulfococcus sp. TaxID=2025834 RepID=UPI0035930394